MLMITIFITALFTYLMSYSYIKSTKKQLGVKHINGHGFMKRYGTLFVTYVLSNLAIMQFILIYNRSVDPWNVDYLSVGPLYLIVIMILIIGIDILVAMFMIRQFHRKNVVTILKGEGD